MKDSQATVEYKEFVGERYFRLGLKVGWAEFVPGQFVMVEVPGHDILLRRPFGIVKLDGGVLEVCVKVVGRGTTALSKIEKGQTISVLGPLGKGFDLPKETKISILVAGGYGIAPLLPLAKLLKAEKKEVAFYYGAKKSADLLYVEDLKNLGVDLKIATEDGSVGEKGIVTDFLKDVIASEAKQSPGIATAPSGPRNDYIKSIFSCGPQGLLREVARIAAALKIPAQVSLERYMACGTGVCLGCMVKAKDGSYVRACREGPAFDAESIMWD